MAEIGRLTEKIRQRDFKLNALLELTKAINANLPIPDLIAEYERILRNELSIERLALYTSSGQWKCLLSYGLNSDLTQDIHDESFFHQKSISLVAGRKKESFDIVIPVHQDKKPIAYLLVGDEGENEMRISPVIKHMRFIETLTNVLVVAIENRKLVQENMRQVLVRKELELAAEMQAILLPQSLPKTGDYEVSAFYKAHQQVGGDYYDFLQLSEDDIMICMADVSGKGVSAAFLMSNFQAYLRSIFSYKNSDLKDIVIELNKRVMHSAMGEKYITLFLATYNKKTRVMKYINCGHNPPVMADAEGYTQLLKHGTIGLGMFPDLPKIAIGELIIPKNSIVVCYTDGLVETENAQLQEYSVERLEQLILSHFTMKMGDLNSLIVEDVTHFKQEMPFIDDLAILSCRFF